MWKAVREVRGRGGGEFPSVSSQHALFQKQSKFVREWVGGLCSAWKQGPGGRGRAGGGGKRAMVLSTATNCGRQPLWTSALPALPTAALNTHPCIHVCVCAALNTHPPMCMSVPLSTPIHVCVHACAALAGNVQVAFPRWSATTPPTITIALAGGSGSSLRVPAYAINVTDPEDPDQVQLLRLTALESKVGGRGPWGRYCCGGAGVLVVTVEHCGSRAGLHFSISLSLLPPSPFCL